MKNKCIKCGKNLLEDIYCFDNLCEDCYYDEMEKKKINNSKEVKSIECEKINNSMESKKIEAKNKLFTSNNSIVSMIFLAIPILLACFVDDEWGIFCIIALQGIVFAYLCRYVGLKKGIYTGFVWGFFLSFLGLIVLAILPVEKEKNVNQTNSEVCDLEQIADILKKYKDLLDLGAITQEEFEIKKKELLK